MRYAVQIEGLSERAAARRFGIDPRTVSKMMKFSVPPGYVRKKAPAKPKLDPFIPVIDGILRDDKSRPKKQQHTSKRIFERLRTRLHRRHHDREGLRAVAAAAQEMSYRVHPGMLNFGEAIGIIGGGAVHFFAFDLPHLPVLSQRPSLLRRTFGRSHSSASRSRLYDNTTSIPCSTSFEAVRTSAMERSTVCHAETVPRARA